MHSYPYEKYKPESIEHTCTPPLTPPEEREWKHIHGWPKSEVAPEETMPPTGHCVTRRGSLQEDVNVDFDVQHQEVLLLHGPKQRYSHTREHPVPKLQNDREMLVAVEVVGLNPIDWKAP